MLQMYLQLLIPLLMTLRNLTVFPRRLALKGSTPLPRMHRSLALAVECGWCQSHLKVFWFLAIILCAGSGGLTPLPRCRRSSPAPTYPAIIQKQYNQVLKLWISRRRCPPFCQYFSGSYKDSLFSAPIAVLPSMKSAPSSTFRLFPEACCCFRLIIGVCPAKLRDQVAAMRATLASLVGALKVRFICLAPSSWLLVPPCCSYCDSCLLITWGGCSTANFSWYFLSCSSKPRFGQILGLILRTYLMALLKMESYFFMQQAMTRVADCM